jgi:O-methyltransferase involved in polyketide biosynthesis
LIYFQEAQVKQLLANLVEQFPGSLMMFDSTAPLGLKMMSLSSKKFISANFHWSLAHMNHLQDWDKRYKIVNVCQFSALYSQYLKRQSFLKWLYSSIPFLKNLSRLALIQLG